MKRQFLLAVALCAVVVLPASSLYGQAVTGSLLGNVTDSSGAVVPGAKVVITEVNTGLSRSTETNPTGFYSFPTLEPGVYRVTVEREGFRKAVKDRVDVLVNTTVRADLELVPGAVTETVTVTAEIAMLQSDRSDTGRKLEAIQLVNMPLGFNRNFQNLLNLVPGTTRAFRPHSEFFNSQDSLSTQVNGLSRLANNVQFEGVDNNHRTGLLSVLIPPIEAIETVDVSTSNYEAELGRAGGAVTNVMLRSGTNELHGSVYEFHKDSAMGARDTFVPTKPVTTYNYYGGTIGGPIRKNKTFFFGDFLQLKDRRGDGYVITVPLPALRAGDFSSLIGRAVLYDPATGDKNTGVGRVAFQNNIIPDARISPITKRYLALVPMPNLGSGLTNNYTGATTRSKDNNLFDVKVDHQPNDKDRFSVRYSFQRPVVTDPPRFGVAGGAGGKEFSATGVNRTQSAAVNYTRLFSPTLIMEARVGLSRYANIAENSDIGTNAAEAIGIKGANLDRWSSGLTQISISGYADPLLGYAASLPWNRAETNIDFVNNWTKVLHNHTIKFGADVRRIRDELLQTQDQGGSRGRFRFRNNQTSIPGAATLDQVNSLASFLLDAPNEIGRDLAVAFPAYRTTALFTYLQDKWQVTPKLTLDLGLRHEFWPPATPRLKGGFSNYDPSNNTLVLAGIGNNPMNLGRETYHTEFAPRLGIAYRLSSKTVVRGGFGISYFPFPDNTYAYNFPIKQNNQFSGATTFGLARTSVSPDVYGAMATGFPPPQTAAIPSNGIINATGILLSQSYAIIPKDFHEGYVESWNFAIQRQLPRNFTLETAYVANHTVRAPVAYNINASQVINSGTAGQPLFQKFGKTADATLRYVGLSNNYESLQVKLDRRFSGGLLMTTAYTWGKAMGYSSEDGGLQWYVAPKLNYSRLNFDRTHNFVQSYVYELPFGKNKRWLRSGVGRWVLGDWQLNGILTLTTGRPINDFNSGISLNSPGNGNNTPDLTGPVKILHGIAGPSGTNLWFDTSVFLRPLNPDGRTPHLGNMGRNAIDGPSLGDLDLSLFRKFQITERWKGELRFETFNFTNTPSYNNPSASFTSANFGRVTSTLGANDGSYAGAGPRVIQLGVKITF